MLLWDVLFRVDQELAQGKEEPKPYVFHLLGKGRNKFLLCIGPGLRGTKFIEDEQEEERLFRDPT